MTLQATLVADGASDAVLVPILRWLMQQLTAQEVEIRWADLRVLARQPRDLTERLAAAVRLHPCRLLFVHRDAENQDPDRRYVEIGAANRTDCRHVCIVPVRMQEAWLLHDEAALRQAADQRVDGAGVGRGRGRPASAPVASPSRIAKRPPTSTCTVPSAG